VGRNNYGELGDGTNTCKTIPVQIPGFTGVTRECLGEIRFAYLLKMMVRHGRQEVMVWANWAMVLYKLGKNYPVQITSLTGKIVAVAAGPSFPLFLKSDGTVCVCGL